MKLANVPDWSHLQFPSKNFSPIQKPRGFWIGSLESPANKILLIDVFEPFPYLKDSSVLLQSQPQWDVINNDSLCIYAHDQIRYSKIQTKNLNEKSSSVQTKAPPFLPTPSLPPLEVTIVQNLQPGQITFRVIFVLHVIRCCCCCCCYDSTEMQKVAYAADISVLFFSAGAKFWAIWGNFWAILGHFWAILGKFRSFLGLFLVLIFCGKICICSI